MAGNPDSPVNPARDRWFLERVAEGDLDAVAALGHDGVEDAAGSGGQEIRTWLLALAAVGAPTVWSSYEPVPGWTTGTGIATTFPVALGRTAQAGAHGAAPGC